jgi:hypothetical protein
VTADTVRFLQVSEHSPLAVGPTEKTVQEALLVPDDAGLIGEATPFDRASLEHAIDQFFDRLDDLGVGKLGDQGKTRLIPLSLTVIGMITALEVARRQLHPRIDDRRTMKQQGSLGSESLLGFPELPGSWSTRLT